MNFLAATALLVVGPEDAFWLLVALTEGYFHESYFDESLSGQNPFSHHSHTIIPTFFFIVFSHP